MYTGFSALQVLNVSAAVLPPGCLACLAAASQLSRLELGSPTRALLTDTMLPQIQARAWISAAGSLACVFDVACLLLLLWQTQAHACTNCSAAAWRCAG